MINNRQENTIEKLSRLMTRFFGSWWAVVLHTLLVLIWFIFRFNLEYFMLWISLEAIFIWVVYLAASNRREEKHDHREALQQIKMKEKLLESLANGEKEAEKLNQIQKMIYELQEEVRTFKKK